MFSLISGFLQWLFQKTEVQIIILGLDNAGKTTLLEQTKNIFLKKQNGGIPLDKIPPTVGLNIGRIEIDNCKILLWDLGGQSALRTIWKQYYSEAHGIVFVVDAADPDRFEEARDILDSILKQPELAGLPLLLLANKQDLANSVSSDEIDAVFQITRDRGYGSKRFKRLQPISAYTKFGIEDGVRWLINRAINNPEFTRRQ